jgi:hypothetical protein
MPLNFGGEIIPPPCSLTSSLMCGVCQRCERSTSADKSNSRDQLPPTLRPQVISHRTVSYEKEAYSSGRWPTSKAKHAAYEALGPFLDKKILNGRVDGDHYFDTLADDASFEFLFVCRRALVRDRVFVCMKRPKRYRENCETVAMVSMSDKPIVRQAARQWQALRTMLKAGMEHFESIVAEDFGKFETVIRNELTGEWIYLQFEPQPPKIYSSNRYDGNHWTTYRRFKKDPKDSRIKLWEHRPPDGERFVSIEDLADECLSVLARSASCT